MSRFRVIGYGKGGTPRVKFDAATHAISPEMHSVEIAIDGSASFNLTLKEAQVLYAELGEKIQEGSDEAL